MRQILELLVSVSALEYNYTLFLHDVQTDICSTHGYKVLLGYWRFFFSFQTFYVIICYFIVFH